MYFEKGLQTDLGYYNSHDYRLFKEFGVNISDIPGDIFDCD
jgi:hypothetical protein